jgi:hypothetical protein
MVLGLSGFQSQAITYPNDNVAYEHIHKKTIEGFVLYQSAHESIAFLLGMLIFGAKELSLRQTASVAKGAKDFRHVGSGMFIENWS